MRNCRLIKAEYLKEYELLLFYNDGSQRIIDLTSFLWGEMFEPLKDVKNFMDFHMEEQAGTIEWYNGADICPDVLYEKSCEVVRGKDRSAAAPPSGNSCRALGKRC